MHDAPSRQPPQVNYLLGSEVCERLSFHGMRSILTLYMVQALLYDGRDATVRYHLFVTATCLTPLLGELLADRFLGRYRAILWISLCCVSGYALLGAWETRTGLLGGLALVAAGAGSMKPCLSAFVGDQLDSEHRGLLDRIHGGFQWVVHLGAATATLSIPWLLDRFGPAVALAVPAVLMAGALAVFWVGRRGYVRAPPAGRDPHAFARVLATAVRRLGTGRHADHWLDGARARHPAGAVEGAKAVVRIAAVFAAATVFWALFAQRGSTWVLQAKAMDLAVGPLRLSPSQLPALNPLLIMLIIPLLDRGLFPLLERRHGPLPLLSRMTAGMFATVLSFAAAALVQNAIDAGATPSVLWQVPQYVLLTAGEVLVSVTALEFAYGQAPRAMRSTITSLWFLAVGLGNLLTATLAGLVPLRGAAYFWFFATLMLLAAIAFAQVARGYRRAPAAPGAPAAG